MNFVVQNIDYLGANKDANHVPIAKALNWFGQDFEKHGKLKYCYRNKCWSYVRKTYGFSWNKIFYPFPFQSVKYKTWL